ncbi:hypothetical protein COCSUDRAFT_64488 [Coccomyxa subellipsoidea C-169]|uniref:Transcription factor IIA, alpha/beta subunit n=1 Tax=Coccomyxa subellipsoidea (strain C-169) TaxID=574566 RepID=I0Z712_COCSC|nr:hypothetical protein COCSUDRAFT_64488 [Coccomyxa subellipsoidea C-169]EIE26431.1 hypothetical protein COCSUDRAFT_64488 [Coccomyxa subellipsoidea C-169]|eukprot:XP_005650975.1 hypothetical protein COCSUDRAFT_64488 [Coccomyxa subellipsoidea C-169]
MQDSSVSTVYRNVIDDVIARVKADFVQEGVDEAVLDELRVLWEAKLQQSGVLEPENAPTHALSGLPPQYLTPGLQAPKIEQQQYGRPGFQTASVQQPPLQAPYTLAAHDLVAAASDRQAFGPAGPSGTGPSLGSSSAAGTALPGLTGDSRKRKAEDPPGAYENQQRQTLPAHQNGTIPQQDGSDDPQEHDKGKQEKEDNLSDVSSDDEKDEECDNVVIAQFEKVSRTKNRWKCQLKDGIITIDGRDYLFHRASGEMQF